MHACTHSHLLTHTHSLTRTLTVSHTRTHPSPQAPDNPVTVLPYLQERRLLTGSNNGELKMWNFNSGSQLRQFVHREEHVEYSALLFVHDADRQSSMVRQSFLWLLEGMLQHMGS